MIPATMTKTPKISMPTPTRWIQLLVVDSKAGRRAILASIVDPGSILFRHDIHFTQSRPVVVLTLVGPLWQLDPLGRQAPVGDCLQQMRDAVESRASFIFRANHIPGRMLGIRGLEHQVARPRIVVPASVGFEIHWTEFPLPERIVDPRSKPLLLF